MKADTLLSWEKVELANILAEKQADVKDLLEAIPAIEDSGTLEDSILDDYLEDNWRQILSCLDAEDLWYWINEKDEEAADARWQNESLEQESEDAEMEYYWSLIEQMYRFRDMDLAERRGYPSKFRKS